MNTAHQLSVDETSRLAVTATVADLENWARSVAVHGLELDDLIDVLDVLRADSLPRDSTPPRLPDSCSQLDPPSTGSHSCASANSAMPRGLGGW